MAPAYPHLVSRTSAVLNILMRLLVAKCIMDRCSPPWVRFFRRSRPDWAFSASRPPFRRRDRGRGLDLRLRLVAGPFLSTRSSFPDPPSRAEIGGLVYGLRLAVNLASFLGYAAVRMGEFICPHGFVMFQSSLFRVEIRGLD